MATFYPMARTKTRLNTVGIAHRSKNIHPDTSLTRCTVNRSNSRDSCIYQRFCADGSLKTSRTEVYAPIVNIHGVSRTRLRIGIEAVGIERESIVSKWTIIEIIGGGNFFDQIGKRVIDYLPNFNESSSRGGKGSKLADTVCIARLG